MTRLEALKWCWDNISSADNKFVWEEVENTIGGVYFEELKYMGFISRWFNWEENRSRVHMSSLGKSYCEEIFTTQGDEHTEVTTVEKAAEVFSEMLVELCPELLGFGGAAKEWENEFRKRLEE